MPQRRQNRIKDLPQASTVTTRSPPAAVPLVLQVTLSLLIPLAPQQPDTSKENAKIQTVMSRLQRKKSKRRIILRDCGKASSKVQGTHNKKLIYNVMQLQSFNS